MFVRGRRTRIMKDFLKKLLVQQPGQGASATLPELDGMP